MKIEILTAEVKEQVLTIATKHNIVADTKDIYTASFFFDDEWDGFAKAVIFRSKNNIGFAFLDSSNKCVIPAEVIEAGYLGIGIQGNKNGQVITTKKADRVEIFESGGSMDVVPAPFTQSEFDKLMDELARVQKIAEQSIADAEQSHVDAEQVAADKTEVANNKAVVLQKATEVANNTKVATTAATTATAQAGVTQSLYDQLQPMNADVSSKAPSIVSEAAGSVITLDDSSNMPLQRLTIYGKSVQDGTPTPEAPVEIKSAENPELGVAGSNLLDFDDYINRVNDNSAVRPEIYQNKSCLYINVSKLLGKPEYILLNLPCLKVGKKYRIKFSGYMIVNEALGPTAGGIYFYLLNSDGSTIRKLFFNNREEKQVVETVLNVEEGNIGIVLSYGSVSFGYLIVDECYIVEEGQEPVANPLQSLDFPYTLRGIPVASGGNYTDESGRQWVCDTLEVNANGTGKLVQRVYETIISNDKWLVNVIGEKRELYDVTITDAVKVTNDDTVVRIMSNKYEGHSALVSLNTSKLIDAICVISNSRIAVSTTILYGSIDTFRKAIGDLAIIYQLETPIETDLTAEEVQAFLALHTNKPYSTIFNSAGVGQKVEYVADTKTYIDNKFTELQNAILSTGGNV